MSLQVHDVEGSNTLKQTLIAAAYAGVKVDVNPVKPGESKGKPFLAKFPLGRTPSIVTDSGNITGANAVLRHVARTSGKLYGSNDFEATEIDQLLDWTISDVDLPAAAWIYPIKEYIVNNPAATNKAKGDIRKALGALNDRLATRTFLVGERVSIADISVAVSFVDLYTTVLDAGFRKQFSHTNRWFQTCVNQPQFAEVLGKVTLCSKMAVAKAPPKEAAPAKKEAPKKAAAPKKEAAPAEAPAPKAEKKRSPLEDLPRSKFVLDNWKREYSNTDTRPQAIPWLWENFDPEGFSFWFCEYKYPEDLTRVYMAANTVGGWLQRAEPCRKWGFGSICIEGEEPKLEAHGVFIFRGTESVPEEMSETPDFDSWKFWKADHNDPKQKSLIEDYLAWDGDLNGKTFNQGKVFK